jgi:two-component system, LuxR family, sensor kinase FixL
MPEPHPKASSHAERLLASIVASSDDAIISKTIDGVVTSWNGGAERIFGYTADEIVGRPISLLAVPGREDEMPGILEKLRGGERVDHFETVRRHKDGSTRIVSLSVSPIHDASGAVVGAAKVARDITAVRQAAKLLATKEAELQTNNLHLLHAARLGELGQMAAALAHEINQPLSAIINYLRGSQQHLRSDDPESRRKVAKGVSLATEQAIRAGEIVQRLRAFAKPGEGRRGAESVGRILTESAAIAAIDAKQRGVRVILPSPEPTELVLADRIEVQQVLLNLIRNALDAMDGVERRELRLSSAPAEDMVEVAVADTGPGLAREVRERLFEPFVTTKANGMGIGLSICRRIVDAHGGRFWAEDNAGGGTVFRFTLQAAAPA